MPLVLPHVAVTSRQNTRVVYIWDTLVEAEVVRGGLVLRREMHYLYKVDRGLCYFGVTKDNSLYKRKFQIVFQLADLVDPPEFKRKVINLYHEGYLTGHDSVIHPYYDNETDLPRI